MSVFKYISQLANSQRRLIDGLASDKVYSGAQEKVIHYLFNNEDNTIYQKDIEKVFGLRASTATELLNSLEKMDMIKRIPSKKDARFKEIALTDNARQYRDDIFSDMDYLETMLTLNIDRKELAAWLAVTQKMLANLERTEHEK